LLEDFIAINKKLERIARVFISNKDCGEETKIAERQRESVCKRQRIAEEERWHRS
jgi:hypothetical protein